jgi:hypothetical protein
VSHDKFNRVQKLKLGDPTAKAVLSYIAGRDGKEGCTASRATMSLETEIPERTINRKLAWLKSLGLISIRRRYLKSAIIRALLPDATDMPSDGRSVDLSDRPSGGRSVRPDDLPPEKSEHAISEANKRKEHAVRAARTGQPTDWPAPCAQHSGVASEDDEAIEAGPTAENFSLGMSASLSLLGSRAADLPNAGEMKTKVQATTAAAHGEIDKRSDPARLVGPMLTAEQRGENEANARLNADLLQVGEKFYAAVVERMPEGHWTKAIAAEVAERGAGLAMIKAVMIDQP